MLSIIENYILENFWFDEKSGNVYRKRNDEEVGHIKSTKTDYKHKVCTIKKRQVSVHRIAWFLYYKKWPEYQIDHIDGNPLNNKIENLRDVPSRVNNQNRRCHREGKKVGCTGVTKNGKFLSQIRIGGKQITLGIFLTEDEACRAYDEALFLIEKGEFPEISQRKSNIKYSESKNKWNAIIWIKKVRYNLGEYESYDEAYNAYCKAKENGKIGILPLPIPKREPRGCYYHRRSNTWGARITIAGKIKSLGYYHTLEEASQVRKRAIEELAHS